MRKRLRIGTSFHALGMADGWFRSGLYMELPSVHEIVSLRITAKEPSVSNDRRRRINKKKPSKIARFYDDRSAVENRRTEHRLVRDENRVIST